MHSLNTSAKILGRIEKVKKSEMSTSEKIELIVALRKSLKKAVENDKEK